MATNYFLMKESQCDLLNDFKNFFQMVIDNQKLICDLLKNDQSSYKETYEKACFLEKKVNTTYADMLEEIMWIIQRDQPRASYLRFFIAGINSIKDLERISDHSEIICEYFLETEFDEEQKNFFLTSFEISNQILSDLYDFFDKNAFSVNTIEHIKDLRSKSIMKINKNLIQSLHDQSKLLDENSNYIKLILMYRHIERNIEHGINIVQNFGNVHITSR